MKSKVKSLDDVIKLIKPHSKLLVSGFYYVGRPETILEEIRKAGIKHLYVVVNDIAFPDDGVGQLVMNDQVDYLATSFLGVNKEINKKVRELMEKKNFKLEFVPQGTLIEAIRAAGFGLGGFLTPVGVGTVVEKGKKRIEIDGKEYLLELPIKGDFGLVKAYKADKFGNLIFRQSARNFNPYVAMAADYTIAEVEVISDKPLNPERIHLPGIFVDAVVKGKKVKVKRK